VALESGHPASGEGVVSGIELAPGVRAPAGTLRLQYARSGGPGGQNVNKVNSKAELWVRLDALIGLSPAAIGRLKTMAGRRFTLAGELHLVSESERGQEANRQLVMERLREMIVRAKVDPKPRKKTKPSKRAKAKRMDQKKHRGQIKSLRRGSFES
jgi:ribosome-associated protein